MAIKEISQRKKLHQKNNGDRKWLGVMSATNYEFERE